MQDKLMTLIVYLFSSETLQLSIFDVVEKLDVLSIYPFSWLIGLLDSAISSLDLYLSR